MDLTQAPNITCSASQPDPAWTKQLQQGPVLLRCAGCAAGIHVRLQSWTMLCSNCHAQHHFRQQTAHVVLVSLWLRQHLSIEGGLLCRGSFSISSAAARRQGALPDTFLSLDCATKGLAWVNGQPLGWYWPAQGPQHTLYIPGPCLKAGQNAVALLEFGGIEQDCAGVPL